MKRFILILFLLSCSFIKREYFVPPESDIRVVNEKPALTIQDELKFKKSDETNYIIVINPRTEEKWKITFKDFKLLALGKENWDVVSEARPEISDVQDTEDEIIITYNYYKTMKKEGLIYKSSILSGKFYLNKKYLRTGQISYVRYLIDVGIGVGVGVIVYFSINAL